MSLKTEKKLAVIGGGAAGFFCALNAARLSPGLKVQILEKSNRLLTKVKVSGGGRCNVTHACSSVADMSRNYPRGGRMLKKAFHHFFVNDTVEWFMERGVELKTEEDGRMFPVTDDSQTIINCFLSEASALNIDILLRTEINAIQKTDHGFLLLSESGTIRTDYVCIACGGFSKPEQFEWIRALGHSIVSPVPSLFTFNMPAEPITRLMGISLPEADVKICGTGFSEKGPLLITHWGLSGPAILKLSSRAARELNEMNYHFRIQVNWVPSQHETGLREKWKDLRTEMARQKIYGKNPFKIPSRLWDHWLERAGIDSEKRWADVTSAEQNKLIKYLTCAEFEVKGKTTFKEEFVTSGGVATGEVDPDTMESRLMPGLYFAGEILDVDGVTGGFNFQNAWTTGMIAARAIASGD